MKAEDAEEEEEGRAMAVSVDRTDLSSC